MFDAARRAGRAIQFLGHRGESRRWSTVALTLAAVAVSHGASAADGTAPGADGWIVAAIACALLLGTVAATIYFWRRSAVAAADARTIVDALDPEAPARLITRRDGTVIAANAAWRKAFGNDTARPLSAIARRLDDKAKLDWLRTAAAAGDTARLDLPADGETGPGATLAVMPAPGDNDHAVWSVEGQGDPQDAGTDMPDPASFLALTQALGVGAYTADGEGRILSANALFASWTGLTPGDQNGRAAKLHDLLVEPADDDVQAHLLSAGEGTAPTGSARLKNGADGGRLVHTGALIAQNADGGVSRVLGVALAPPVTDRPVAAPRDADPSTGIFDAAPCPIVIVDMLGRIDDANPAFDRLTGADNDDAIGAFFKEYIVADDQADYAAWHTGLIRGKDQAKPLPVRFVGSRDLRFALHPVRRENVAGKLADIVVFAVEAAENVIDMQTTQAQKMELVGQLAGGVAHDFNNLLTAMIGFCDLLLQNHSPKDQSFADIMQIKQNANRAANLVRQLLAFSRQQVLQPRVLDLTDVLSELSHLLGRLMGANIELEMIHGRDLGLVKADHGQLEQVIINLAVNARDAMDEGGTLTIRTSDVPAGHPKISEFDQLPDQDYVVVEVSDTGSGMPPDVIEKIYEPFFTTKDVGQGTGLGLSTVYGIVSQTGGHIFVDSTLGLGTTFTIFLPRFQDDTESTAVHAERTEAESRRDLTGSGTVLLVEDEDAVRLFGARALRNKGYEVIEAINGEDAVDILASNEHEIDLLVTDVMMPGLDGPGLIRKVRKTHPDLKVIFISGYTEDTFRKRLDDGAVVHFLPKPFSLQQLAGKVKEVIQEEPVEPAES